MKSDIVTYTQKKIEELELIKKNVKFYQENEDRVILPLDALFINSGITPTSIPVDFILSLHGFESSRRLYVFDILDIRDTKDKIPEYMSEKSYQKFLTEVNEALLTIGFSVDMKMSSEQREYYDKFVREREAEMPFFEEISYSSWCTLIKGIVFSTVPESARPFLCQKYAELLNEMTEDIISKCEGKRTERTTLRRYIDSFLASKNINISELRQFSWEEVEKSKGRKRR